jgi:16S rRNA (guanine(966)-N(2))-methyltransferase RsmD
VSGLRVIAGEFRGRRLATPGWEGLRPTSDRLRETLFNILAARVPGARVVDGFAGTGALGIEALSRGAAHVTFIERDRRAVVLIRANLERCGAAPGRYTIVRADFLSSREREAGATANLVLLDPPYDVEDLEGALVVAETRLRPRALVVLEHARRRESPARAGGLSRVRVLPSGDSALSFYESP